MLTTKVFNALVTELLAE